MKIEKVIFDVGKVLIQFNPRELYKKIFDNDADINFFFKEICTWDWHTEQDLVYDTRPATNIKIKEFPKYKKEIEAFYGRFQEMITGQYDENISIALNLKNKNIPIYILSNFPGDQFDLFSSKNNYIQEFDDMIISGKVGLKKPDPKIYELCIKKFKCNPEKTLFIDDRPENTEAARKLKFKTITLDRPEKLKEYIKNFSFNENHI